MASPGGMTPIRILFSRVFRRTVNSAQAYLRDRPQQREFVVRWINRWPGLKRRLRGYLSSRPTATPVHRAKVGQAIDAEGDINWRDYPASVRHSFDRLTRARIDARRDEESEQ